MTPKQKLIEQAGFSQTFEVDRLNRLIDLVVAECVTAVIDSPRDHCPTTFDQEQRSATIERCVQNIKHKFQ
jgi:hypothetical protein